MNMDMVVNLLRPQLEVTKEDIEPIIYMGLYHDRDLIGHQMHLLKIPQNRIMPNIKNEILNWIGNKAVTIDELHDFIKLKLDDSYEIGDAGVIINDMIAGELLIANDFEIKRKA